MKQENDYKQARFIALGLSPIGKIAGNIEPIVANCGLPDGIYFSMLQKGELLVFYAYDQPPMVFKMKNINIEEEAITVVKDNCIWESDFYGF